MLLDKDPILRRGGNIKRGALTAATRISLAIGASVLPLLIPPSPLEQVVAAQSGSSESAQRPVDCPPEAEERIEYLTRFTSERIQLDPEEGDETANFRIEPMRSDFPNSGRLIYIPRPQIFERVVEFPLSHRIRGAGMEIVHWLILSSSGTFFMGGAIGRAGNFRSDEYGIYEASRPINASSVQTLIQIGGIQSWFTWRERFISSEHGLPRVDFNWFEGQSQGLVVDGISVKPGRYQIPNCRPSRRV